ncbi:MAG: DUF3500 domain-containing protein [Thermomicrobiales bacterium]
MRGIPATELDADQRAALPALIGAVGREDGRWPRGGQDGRRGGAPRRYAPGLIGETVELASVFYDRIHSPVVPIEFDHQEPGPLGRDSDFYGETGPSRFHIHAIIRTPNGNDDGPTSWLNTTQQACIMRGRQWPARPRECLRARQAPGR